MASRITRKTSASEANSKTNVLPLVKAVVKALDDKKAGNLRVLYVGGKSSITDYIVVASGQANTHLRALRIELEHVLDKARAPIAGIESSDGSGWIVFDAYQIMIHLFMPEQRDVYQLEQLWRDGEELDLAEFLAPVPAPVAAKPTKPAAKVVKKAAKKKSVTAAKKVPTKKAAAKKTSGSKTAAKKAPTKKAPVKKIPAKKAPVKKSTTKPAKKKLA